MGDRKVMLTDWARYPDTTILLLYICNYCRVLYSTVLYYTVQYGRTRYTLLLRTRFVVKRCMGRDKDATVA